MRNMPEKEFQIRLGRMLRELGCRVYFDKKISDEFLTFKGDRKKIDIIFFHDLTNWLPSPIGLEIKPKDCSFKDISIAMVNQLRGNYQNCEYHIKEEDWEGRLPFLGLATEEGINTGFIYSNKSRKVDGFSVNFVIERLLWRTDLGMLILDDNRNLVISHMNKYYLFNGKVYTPESAMPSDANAR